jgi:hypothetical protein
MRLRVLRILGEVLHYTIHRRRALAHAITWACGAARYQKSQASPRAFMRTRP